MRRVPRLHVVTTREVLEREGFVEAATHVLSVGRLALHLRARGDDGRLLLDRALALRGRRRGAIIVNDRVDVACLAGAGAHLPEAGLTPDRARAILGGEALLSRSVHDARGAGESVALLDFVFFGHVFATRSKPGERPRGLRGLAAAVRAAGARLPVLAVGGVTPERVAAVLRVGGHGVAVVSGVWEAPDPAAAARKYLAALEAADARDRPPRPPRTRRRWSSP